jgi:DDE superfamily endonuclease
VDSRTPGGCALSVAGGAVDLPGNGPQGIKKNELQPWKSQRFCIPEADRARFVARMEAVLDVYEGEYDEMHPLICMDEASRQILSDVTAPLPMKPGSPRRVDDKYERGGVRSLFMFYNPVAGWRRVGCRRSRTRTDWAEELRRLLEEDYPQAEVVTLVCDNLNTHDVASFYFTFDAVTAHRLARRLRIVPTPKNGSWLNMAEMELSLLSRQCLGNRRFGTDSAMDQEIAAWEKDRNENHLGTNWRFTTADARIKLGALYPRK